MISPGQAYWSAFTAWHARGDARLPFRPLPEILALQDRRVRTIVRHAYATVPHYRDAMNAAGLRPADIRGAGDLAHLPLLTGDELARAPERFASDAYPDSRTLVLRSTGTGGTPKLVRHCHQSLFLALAHGQRQRAVFSRFLGRRRRYRELTAMRSDSVSHQMRAFYESRAWVPRMADLERARLTPDTSFHDSVAAINAFRPDLIFGYGSHLGALFRWAHQRGLALHRPGLLWYGADRMPDTERDLIERELGIPVVSTYQADEALRIGFQCEQRRGFHLNLDAVAVRVVGDDGRAVAPGGTGRIVISNLTNRATVLLNYALGDVVSVSASPCPCGRALPTIERIEGRTSDCLLLPGGELRHPLSLLQQLQSLPGVVRVQFVQPALTDVTLRVVADPGADWPALQSRARATLIRVLGGGVRVEIERVEELERAPGGKVCAVIQRCQRPS